VSQLHCLNPEYSTTRCVTRTPPLGGDSSDKVSSSTLLPPRLSRKGEGGLRTHGYFKMARHPPNNAATIDEGNTLPNPLVTVITVVFNGQKTLENTILSVITRTYDNIEYIIIDGGSTDGTLDIIQKYDHTIDYWVSEPDEGIYDAMNKAAGIALGDWIYFLGCDDLLVSNLRHIPPLFSNHNTLYYGDVYMPRQHQRYDGRFSGFKLVLRNICQQAIFYPRSLFGKYRFADKYTTWADYYLNIRCYADPAFSLVYVPELIAIYNDRSGASFARIDPDFERDRGRLALQYFPPSVYVYFLLRRGLSRLFGSLRIKDAVNRLLS
jgi:glycosyltransferase involved in cell wall biosynthesis